MWNIKNMILLMRYASNILRFVDVSDHKSFGFKSHYCHILIEDILPIAFKSCAPLKEVLNIVIELSYFLKSICAKVINPS